MTLTTPLTTPQLIALHQGPVDYQPEMEGLRREGRSVDDSIFNLRQLLAEGLTVCGIVAHPNGTLWLFDTGEQYLSCLKSHQLDWFGVPLEEDYQGPVPL